MSNESLSDDKSKLDKPLNPSYNGMRQYGIYSAIVFQMLATIGLSFWGGKKLSDYLEIKNNLLVVAIGFLGMGLAFYNIVRQMKNLENK